MPGLIGVGQNYEQQAQSLSGTLGDIELKRKEEQKQATVAHRSAEATGAGTGAVLGFTAGASAAGVSTLGAISGGAISGSWAGPVGALIGAGIGYLAGSFS